MAPPMAMSWMCRLDSPRSSVGSELVVLMLVAFQECGVTPSNLLCSRRQTRLAPGRQRQQVALRATAACATGEGPVNLVRRTRHCSWSLPTLYLNLRVFTSTRILGEACSFGARSSFCAAFQSCLFVAVRVPESFPGRKLLLRRPPLVRTGLSRHASTACVVIAITVCAEQ